MDGEKLKIMYLLETQNRRRINNKSWSFIAAGERVINTEPFFIKIQKLICKTTRFSRDHENHNNNAVVNISTGYHGCLFAAAGEGWKVINVFTREQQ